MTRAADRLIVCGADGIRKRPKGCWYDLVRDALDPLLVDEGEDEEKVLRYRKTAREQRQERAPPMVAAGDSRAGANFRRGCGSRSARSAAPVSLSPSSAFDEEIGREFAHAAGSAADRRKALARGTHRASADAVAARHSAAPAARTPSRAI